MNRKVKVAILKVLDSSIIFSSTLLSSFLLQGMLPVNRRMLMYACIVQVVGYIVLGMVFNVFNRINRFTSVYALVSLFLSISLASVISGSVFVIMGATETFRMHLLLSYLISVCVLLASRIIWRLLVEFIANSKRVKGETTQPTIIIGAGAAGSLLYNSLKNNQDKTHMEIVGFLDDDLNKHKTVFYGKKVLGSISDLPDVVNAFDIEVVILAVPSMTPEQNERVVDITNELSVELYTIPSMEDLALGQVSVSKLREIDVVDLLGRDEVRLDMTSIENHIKDKTILVTGAGGSIGSEICRQVLPFAPKRLLLFGHGENSIYLIEKELRRKYKDCDTEIVALIADVRDRARIDDIMATYQPDIVYHAAAHKHVPLMQSNPREALMNNIHGTKNMAESALAHNVASFVMVSTDKAVNPPNVMGATKRVAEMIVTGLNDKGTTKFSAVRFGNVLGSRGSVVPLFKEQVAAGGPVTVTDFRMTRYFMTIPEASRLVIQSGALAQGGEIFILDMGEPVKIVDLAKAVIKLSGYKTEDIDIVESGIRPGEKLYEELLVDKEIAKEQVHEKIFVGNVNGFSYTEVLDKISSLPEDDVALGEELIHFANASSKE